MKDKNKWNVLKFAFGSLLFGLCFSMASSIETKAAVSSSDVKIIYSEEEVKVTSSKLVYYGVAKSGTDTILKSTSMLPAVKDTDGKYLIDYSVLTQTKDIWLALTDDMTENEKGMVPISTIEISAAPKKTVFLIDWAKEGVSGKDIFSSVTVTDSENKTVTYRKLKSGETATDILKSIDDLKIEWKKGINGSFAKISTLSEARWKSYLTSKANIYFRVGADDSAGSRMSKEVKIKPSSSSAPTVKLDVNKLSVNLKNGLEFRFLGSEKWNTILPYSSKSASATYLVGGINKYDPNVHQTNSKVAEFGIDKIKTLSNGAAYVVSDSDLSTIKESGLDLATDGSITLEYRTAATSKKPASIARIITIPGQADVPTATVSVATGSTMTYTFTAITKAASDIVGASTFEYLLIEKADIPKLDFSEARWTAIKPGGKLTSTSKSTFELSDGTKKTYTLSETDVVVLLRRKGTSASTKSQAVLASEYATLALQKS